ncbi:MAG: hypothetical protein AAFN40_16975 [Cyanobacteria bacterium J06560_6]
MYSMYSEDDVIRAANRIQDYLPSLFGDDKAAVIQENLSELLSLSENGQKVDTQILQLLTGETPTREWLLDLFQKEGKLSGNTIPKDRGGHQLPPGQPLSPAPNTYRYYCPTENCKFSQALTGSAEPIPDCPIHDCQLVSITNFE